MSPRIAIVGAGAAGVYAAEALLVQIPGVSIDVIERLPAPYGLVRYGVAPDHPRIRKNIDTLQETLLHPAIRLWCNVDVGTDVTVDELRRAYNGVVIATGADRDVSFDIPGADLPQSFGAADFVAWYDGHPEAPTRWNLEAESVAVLGAGNVALDVTRILAKHATHLTSTDTPDHILDQLGGSRLRDIHLFARRGPADARFSAWELRELGEQHDVEVVIDRAELDLDEHAERMLTQFAQRRIIVRTLDELAQRPSVGASRRIHLHFRHRPVRLLGSARVEGIEFERTASDPLGRMIGTSEFVRYDVDAVYRAIGYRSSPVPGVPFDTERGVVPHREGRVIGADGAPIAGLYAAGWFKRGPIGLIGATRADAAATVKRLAVDLLTAAPNVDGDTGPLARLTGAVDWAGWCRIDDAERAAGASRGRERIKIVARDTMLELAKR